MINNNLDYSDIDKYYIDNIDNIILTDVIKITKETYNKIDMLMWKYYYTIDYLPLILSFNNLPDITEIPIGTIFKFPEINSLLSNIILLNENEDKIVQGITSLFPEKKQIKNTTTLASPKLNINLRKVNYDETSGIITY